jgi:disulfide bond formation protein DsbB
MRHTQTASNPAWIFLFLAWITAMIATLGSLFFSEVMLFPPCVMCWYQRICMYPLAVIFFVALFSNDRSIIQYATPLIGFGLFFAIYHNLLYYGILPESVAPCSQGVSCTSDYINWFGFITIQLLSLVAFVLVAWFLYLFSKKVPS